MEQKGMLISACVGVGVGVGLGLASGQTKWGPNSVSSTAITPEKIEHEMLRLIVDGRESNVTFDNFPYYLRYSILFLFHFPNFQGYRSHCHLQYFFKDYTVGMVYTICSYSYSNKWKEKYILTSEFL
jgi:hypothetical protein